MNPYFDIFHITANMSHLYKKSVDINTNPFNHHSWFPANLTSIDDVWLDIHVLHNTLLPLGFQMFPKRYLHCHEVFTATVTTDPAKYIMSRLTITPLKANLKLEVLRQRSEVYDSCSIDTWWGAGSNIIEEYLSSTERLSFDCYHSIKSSGGNIPSCPALWLPVLNDHHISPSKVPQFL